jgi:hypothetical protein
MVVGAQASSYRAGGLGAQAMILSASQALWFQLQGDNTGLPVLLGCPHEHYGEACRRPPWPADFLLPFEAGDWILQSALVTPNFVQSSSRDFQRIHIDKSMISQHYKQNNSITHLRVLSVHGKDIQYSVAAYIELTKTSLVTMLNILKLSKTEITKNSSFNHTSYLLTVSPYYSQSAVASLLSLSMGPAF